MSKKHVLIGLIYAFLAACGPRAPARALADASLDTPEAVAARIRSVVTAPQSVSYDGLAGERVRLLAFSDDPNLCNNLGHGRGVAASSTVFALMGGPPATDYRAQGDIHRVLTAAMGSGSGPVAIFTAQLLDDSCRLVKATDSEDVASIAQDGTLHVAATRTHPCEGTLDVTLSADQAPLHGAFKAMPCNGLLDSIGRMMPPSQAEGGKATALDCIE